VLSRACYAGCVLEYPTCREVLAECSPSRRSRRPCIRRRGASACGFGSCTGRYMAVRGIRRAEGLAHVHIADSVAAANLTRWCLRRSEHISRCRQERSVKPSAQPTLVRTQHLPQVSAAQSLDSRQIDGAVTGSGLTSTLIKRSPPPGPATGRLRSGPPSPPGWGQWPGMRIRLPAFGGVGSAACAVAIIRTARERGGGMGVTRSVVRSTCRSISSFVATCSPLPDSAIW